MGVVFEEGELLLFQEELLLLLLVLEIGESEIGMLTAANAREGEEDDEQNNLLLSVLRNFK